MSARFIIRVDDVGQGLDQSERDVGLTMFRKWMDAWGTPDEPIYLGVVPASLGWYEHEYLLDLEANTGAVISLHGYDHADQVLTPEHIEMASHYFPKARHVIPPYNKYDEQTLGGVWCLAQDGKPGVIFGGFDGEHHNFGLRPYMPSNRVLHLNAPRLLYARCYQLAQITSSPLSPVDMGYPFVVTLHWRWDWDFLDGVTKLRKLLEGRMVSTDEALS